VTLGKLLSGKAAVVQPYINEIDQGMAGGSTPRDLETLFQLVYLRFTEPRSDTTAFAALQSQARALVSNQSASPEVVFGQTVAAELASHSPRRAAPSLTTIDRWNLDKSMAFYKARFADAANFTFVFVGSFTPETLKPFVETYLASLPATRAKETWRDLGIRTPTGVVEKTVSQGIAPKSAVAVVFSGPFQYDDEHVMAFRTMTLVLQSRLLDVIRQELGGTYSITVSPSAEKFPTPTYTVRIDWTCDPGQVQTLVARVFQEIEFVKTQPFRPEGMAGLRQSLLRELDERRVPDSLEDVLVNAGFGGRAGSRGYGVGLGLALHGSSRMSVGNG
jgi:zinc protease